MEKKETTKKKMEIPKIKKDKITTYYQEHSGNNIPSLSKGTPAYGSLENGKLLPYYGQNFQYFSELSYLSGRGFMNHRLRDLLIESFDSLENYFPKDTFYIMETSHEKGGNFFPHRTHQNGLSVDLMMPYLKNGKKYSGLDHLGIMHYQLQFNNNAEWEKDKSIQPDFEKVALQIHFLHQLAGRHDLKISKIIIKTEWLKFLLATNNAKKYQLNQFPFVRSLSPIVNEQHDDHFHVDFVSK